MAADLEAIVGEIIPDFADSIEFADGLFVMTTATDHKNNLNRTGLKGDNARRLRVETIANSAGGTAQVAIVAQPSTGFLNGRFYADKSPTEDCLGRTTVGLTRSKSLTILVSPLDMLGLMGMAQVVATIAYGIRGLRTGETTWSWPDFHSDPTQENLGQIMVAQSGTGLDVPTLSHCQPIQGQTHQGNQKRKIPTHIGAGIRA